MHIPGSPLLRAPKNRTKVLVLVGGAVLVAMLFLILEARMMHLGPFSGTLEQQHHHHSADQHPFVDLRARATKKKSGDDGTSSLDSLLSERQRLLSENAALKLQVKKMHEDAGGAVTAANANAADAAASSSSSQQQQQQHDQHQSSGAAAAPWLIIGIPTVPRKRVSGDPSRPVLLRTLESIRRQIFRPFSLFSSSVASDDSSQIKVVVLNNRAGSHAAFTEARMLWRGEPWIEFHENESPYGDPPFPNATTVSPEFESRNQDAPTERVRRQTLDVASLLDVVRGRSQYFLFYEDDFHFCDNALLHLVSMIERANTYFGAGPNQWSAIRCSFGLAGIVMQNGGSMISPSEKASKNNNNNNRKKKKKASAEEQEAAAAEDEYKQKFATTMTRTNNDVSVFRDYLLYHVRRRPPDHLAVEFYAKESMSSRRHFGAHRGVVAYRYNILRHDGGASSTVRDESGWAMPGCFEELTEPQNFAVEAWDRTQCPATDLWPCDFVEERKHWSKASRRRGQGFSELADSIRVRDA